MCQHLHLLQVGPLNLLGKRNFCYLLDLKVPFPTDLTIKVESYGDVMVDISYGGAFYAFVDAQRFGLDVTKSRTRDLVDVATAVTSAVKSQVRLVQ